MNYEEKYKEAIESIKRIYNQADSYCKELMEKEFHELRESEDEKIRKALLESFKYQQRESYTDKEWLNGIKLSEIVSWLEKQGKIADESKPKFNVGDWVQIDGGHVMKILDVKKDALCYKILNWCGNESVRIISDIDSIAHLWTIQDAKDGDVVVNKSDGTIGMFQSIGHHPDGGSYNDPSYCFLHCRYDDGFFYADFENGNTMDSDDAIPATKEQRELLFQKMKEAGYEWDKEKKELKKIEPKSAWSEEDERMCQETIDWFEKKCFPYALESENPARESIKWLKSLKPQNRWEPSKEQMEALNKAKNSPANYHDTRLELQSLYNDLKTL